MANGQSARVASNNVSKTRTWLSKLSDSDALEKSVVLTIRILMKIEKCCTH